MEHYRYLCGWLQAFAQADDIGEYYEDKYHTLSILDGIIHGIYKPKIKQIDLELAKKLVNDRKIVSKGNTYPVFADLYKAVSISKEARNYFSSKINKYENITWTTQIIITLLKFFIN